MHWLCRCITYVDDAPPMTMYLLFIADVSPYRCIYSRCIYSRCIVYADSSPSSWRYIAGACILISALTVDVAFAADDNTAQLYFRPTSTLVAGRGDGGRAMGGGMIRNGHRTPEINRTYISSPVMVVSPFDMGTGYGNNRRWCINASI